MSIVIYIDRSSVVFENPVPIQLTKDAYAVIKESFVFMYMKENLLFQSKIFACFLFFDVFIFFYF